MRASHLTGLAVRASLGYHALKIQGIFCLVLQRRQAALNCFAGMLRYRPQDRYALASQGHVRAQMGDFACALLPLQQLVDLDPEDVLPQLEPWKAVQEPGVEALPVELPDGRAVWST